MAAIEVGLIGCLVVLTSHFRPFFFGGGSLVRYPPLLESSQNILAYKMYLPVRYGAEV
jgi:hypothetical protein